MLFRYQKASCVSGISASLPIAAGPSAWWRSAAHWRHRRPCPPGQRPSPPPTLVIPARGAARDNCMCVRTSHPCAAILGVTRNADRDEASSTLSIWTGRRRPAATLASRSENRLYLGRKTRKIMLIAPRMLDVRPAHNQRRPRLAPPDCGRPQRRGYNPLLSTRAMLNSGTVQGAD